MTTAQRTAISSPATGLMVYDSDTNTFWFYNASAWVEHNGSSSSLYGSDGTLTEERTVTLNSNNIKFVGTNSTEGVRIVNNNYPRMVYEAVSNSTDSKKFQVYINPTGDFNIKSLNDAENTELGGIVIKRNGTIDNSVNNSISMGKNSMANVDFNNTWNSIGIGTNTLMNNNDQKNIAIGGLTLPLHTTGNDNIAIGSQVMEKHTTGGDNIAMGTWAMRDATASEDNVILGVGAMVLNTNPVNNSVVGRDSYNAMTSGSENVSLGWGAGNSIVTGNNLALVGTNTDATDGITNATAIGDKAYVAQSNSLILGSINGVNGATADTNVGIGTTTPGSKLAVVGLPVYADNAAATTGGLSAGDFYRTSDGFLKVVF